MRIQRPEKDTCPNQVVEPGTEPRQPDSQYPINQRLNLMVSGITVGITILSFCNWQNHKVYGTVYGKNDAKGKKPKL